MKITLDLSATPLGDSTYAGVTPPQHLKLVRDAFDYLMEHQGSAPTIIRALADAIAAELEPKAYGAIVTTEDGSQWQRWTSAGSGESWMRRGDYPGHARIRRWDQLRVKSIDYEGLK